MVFLHHWGPSPETPNRSWHWSCRGFHGATNADGGFRQVFRLCFCAAPGTCWCDFPLWKCLYWKNASCWICGFVQIWTIDSARYHWSCQLVTPSSELQPQLQQLGWWFSKSATLNLIMNEQTMVDSVEIPELLSGMIFVVAPMLAGDGVLNGLRGEFRNLGLLMKHPFFEVICG